MQVETELRDMFSYSLIPIVIILILLIILFILSKVKRKNISKEKIIIPNNKDSENIKVKYLNDLDNIITEFNNNQISKRKAYQSLSKLIRNFIFEMTNIKVQYYTLSDIEKIDMPSLYELVLEYYDPEFSKTSNANITKSALKTKEVIEKWK